MKRKFQNLTVYDNSVHDNEQTQIKNNMFIYLFTELCLIQVSKKRWEGCTLMHSYHCEVCYHTATYMIKIKKIAVCGIFSTTELMRSVEFTSLWLVFLMHQDFIFDLTN